jgi:uncharacterized OB-fold protein
MSTQSFSQTAFTQHLSERKIMGTRCQACDTLYLPPRPMCAECFGSEMAWTEVPDDGKLVAFTTIHIAPTAMIEAGYGRDKPFCSGIVELENGLAISAQILGLDAAKPEEIEIGTSLKAEFIARGEGEEKTTFLAFRVV